MKERAYKYLFGPVSSRRFGRSLGVDLTPGRVCSFDCRFCQAGRVRRRTIERGEYAPTRAVMDEIAAWARDGVADTVSLAGSGEPTLHARFGDVLRFVRETTPFRAALLSNGSLFTRADVRADARSAHIVKVSLSAWDQASFVALNRPDPGLRLEDLLSAFAQFRAEFSGLFWVEVFLVPGINDAGAQVRRIAERANALRADRIHLNTAVRPTADAGLGALSPGRLRELAALFSPAADIPEGVRPGTAAGGGSRSSALETIRRRPCSAAQLAEIAAVPVARMQDQLDAWVRDGRAQATSVEGVLYYCGKEAGA